MPYYLWWLPSAVFAYNFAYTRMTGKNKIAGYGSFFAYLILGLLFLKRVAFINCAFLFFLSLIFNPTQKTIPLKKIVFVSVMVIIAIVSVFFLFDIINDTAIYEYGKNIFENLFNRFEKDSFTSYDRAEEAIIVFNDSSSLEKIFGYGLGSYAVVNGHLYPTLHTGLFNYLYKGGVFYLGFWIYLFIQFIILFFKRKKLSKYSLACLMVAFSAILSSFYEFGFTHTIMPIGYATPIAYLIGLNRKERVYDHNLL
jgi:hypothetical protein